MLCNNDSNSYLEMPYKHEIPVGLILGTLTENDLQYWQRCLTTVWRINDFQVYGKCQLFSVFQNTDVC